MSEKHFLDLRGLGRVINKIISKIPTKTSDLINDKYFQTGAEVRSYVNAQSFGKVKNVNTGVGLTGGPITETGTIKADLVSETRLGSASEVVSDSDAKVYPVALDSQGKLSVAVPDTVVGAATESPTAIGNESVVGTSRKYAREDHTHNIDVTTGDANGQIKIAGQNVDVKGLGSIAYKDELVESDIPDLSSTYVKQGSDNDSHVEVTLDTTRTAKAYLLATTTPPIKTPTNVVAKADGSVYLDTKPGALSVGQRTSGNVGTSSFTNGNSLLATGNYSHAEGNWSEARGSFSHAEGNASVARGQHSHAEGSVTETTGVASHAEGNATKASGMYSHAEGEYTEARGEGQHVSGKYNIVDESNKYAEIVGNGDNSVRSNARTLDWNGNATYSGRVTVGIGPIDNMDLTTKQYVDDAIDNIIIDTPTDARTVNGHTVESNVPADAVFTDTTYTDATTSSAGLMSASDKTKLNGIESGAEVNVIEGVSVNNTAIPIANKAVNISIPTKTSDLTNDSGYITQADIPSVPEKISDLQNDSGFITAQDIPTIPDSTSDLINDSGFITISDVPTDADTVNGHTVNTDVPSNAVFTDTTYVEATTTSSGLMPAIDKVKLNLIEDNAQENIIESISVNGDEVEVIDKNVDISIPKIDDIFNERTISGNPVYIDDAVNAPATNVTVGIESTQDLNGYDYPWVGGAGNNLLPKIICTPRTENGITFTSNDDGSIHVSGTATKEALSKVERVWETTDETDLTWLEAGTYTVNAFGGRIWVMFTNEAKEQNPIASFNVQNGGSRSITLTEKLAIYIRADILASDGALDTDVKASVVSGSTGLTTWEPYENICPITGVSTVKVTRTGKNLGNFVNGISSDPTTGLPTATNVRRCSMVTPIKIDSTKTYVASGVGNSCFIYAVLNNDTLVRRIVTYATGGTVLDTSGGTDLYVTCFNNPESTNATVEDNLPMVTIQSDDDTYEPYQEQEVEIELNDETFGGTLDVTNGKLTLTHYVYNIPAISSISSSTGGTKKYISFPSVGSYLIDKSVPAISDRMTWVEYANRGEAYHFYYASSNNAVFVTFVPEDATVDSINADLVGGQIVYQLETPIEYTLTPQQIEMLSGENIIWSNANGDIDVTYKAKAADYTEAEKDKLKRTNVYYGTCDTASNISEKQVVLTNGDGFELVPGTLVSVRFVNSNTANNVTLNVNNTGARYVWAGSNVMTGSATGYVGNAGFTHTYMYDGSNWAFLAVGYISDHVGVGYCTTDGNVASKYARQDYYVLRKHNYINVVFRYDNTAKSALTFNINGSGEKPIYINGEPSSETNYTLPNGAYIAYFDGNNYQFRIDGKIPGPTLAMGPYFGVCSDSGVTCSVTVNDDFVLAEGVMINVFFENQSTFNATLNVNNTGAYPIYIYGEQPVTGAIAWGWREGQLVELVFHDSKWWVQNQYFSNAGTTSAGLMTSSHVTKLNSLDPNSTTPIQLTNEDLNDIHPTNTTWYYAVGGNNCTNKPADTFSSFGMVCFRTAGGYIIQLFWPTAWGVYYARTWNGTSWTNWEYPFRDATTSQSGRMSATDKTYLDGIVGTQLTNEDLNDIHPGHFAVYWADSDNTCTHKPTAISVYAFALICLKTTSAYQLQVLFHPTSNRQWRRYWNGSSWSGWSEITYSWNAARTYNGLMSTADKIKLDDLKASTINVTDTYGVAGTAGATVTIQALMDAIASKV